MLIDKIDNFKFSHLEKKKRKEMAKCLVSQLDNSIKTGSKVEIVDVGGNIYLGFVSYLSRSSGRISIDRGV